MKKLHTSILDTLAFHLDFETAVEIAFQIIDAAGDLLYSIENMFGDLVDYLSDHFEMVDAEEIANEVIAKL